MKKLIICAILYSLSATSAHAQYIDAQPGGNVPYTTEQTTARQAEEKAWADGKDLRDTVEEYHELKAALADQLPEATAAISAGDPAPDDFTDTANALASAKSVVQMLGGDDAVAALSQSPAAAIAKAAANQGRSGKVSP